MRVQGRERGQDSSEPRAASPRLSLLIREETGCGGQVTCLCPPPTAHPWGRPRVQEAHGEEEPITTST